MKQMVVFFYGILLSFHSLSAFLRTLASAGDDDEEEADREERRKIELTLRRWLMSTGESDS